MGRMPFGSGIGVAVATAAVLVALAGCTSTSPAPVPTYTPSGSPSGSQSPVPEETAEPQSTVPILRPGQSAAANLQFFDFVNQSTFDAQGRSIGVSIVNNLVDNGFVKADVEVTPDYTALGIEADSILVSVKVQGECLVGQLRPGGYTGIIAPVLGTGKCMVGVTRPIDW